MVLSLIRPFVVSFGTNPSSNPKTFVKNVKKSQNETIITGDSHQVTIEDYIEQARKGIEIPSEHGYLVRITSYRSFVTAKTKRAIRVKFTSYNGMTWQVDYWRHTQWHTERLRKLILVGGFDESWFWFLPVIKIAGNGKPFWDYKFHGY